MQQALNRGTSTNPFCGPVALALLMNKSLDEIDKILSEKLGTNVQKGLFYPLMLQILSEHRFGYLETKKRVFAKSPDDGNYLIVFKAHFGVFKAGIYYDNANPNGVFRSIAGRVDKVYQIFEIPKF